MKETILKILKILLIATLAILGILLVFAVVLLLHWPWWVGIFLLIALIGVVIGGFFLKRIWMKRREQRFVQQVIEQDDAHMRQMTGKEKDELKELQGRWKEAVDALKRSHLRKFGNPLYVLPWYLIMGESGSGKTTAIKSARLSSPFVDVKHTSGISGTRNCDWWFFEQAIMIDTAGRYAIPVDEGRDKEEWQKFLNLLVKYRKKEPIHGLIITVAANKLLESSSEALAQDGKNIRRRIDELMRVMGVKFPVYVLVTKCDLIQGMTQFSDQLPDESTGQPMGVINNDLTTDIESFLNHALSTIGERLRNLRLLMLHKPRAGQAEPGLLLFPEEFDNLTKGIRAFVGAGFQETPYHETPILRGLFFSSGRQEGSPYSRFLNTLGLIGEREVLPGTDRGLFLHDLFSKILPGDRGIFAPTRYAVQWKNLTRNLGLVCWVLIGVALCGLISFSFVRNLNIVNEARQFVQPSVLRGQFMPDLITMDRFNESILHIESQNQNWWYPRFGLNESIRVEKSLKEKYCEQFKTVFLASLDNEMIGTLTNLTYAASDDVVSPYLAHLVRRVNLLQSRYAGEDIEAMQLRPQPDHSVLLMQAEQGIGKEIKQKFAQLYFNYMIWRQDTGEINKEVNLFQSLLKNLIDLKGPTPTWIISWVNQEGSVAPIGLQEYWGGSVRNEGEAFIMPAYTLEGKKMIEAFLVEVEEALPNPLVFVNQKTAFMKWYQPNALNAWENFSAGFPKGKDRLASREEWNRVASLITTDRGPYLLYLNKIVSDLNALYDVGRVPAWLEQVNRIDTFRKAAITDKGALSKVAETGKRVVSKFDQKFGRDTADRSELLALEAYSEYKIALDALVPVSASRIQAYQMVEQVNREKKSLSDSPFYKAGEKVDTFMNVLAESETSQIARDLVWGPVDFLWHYALQEAGCHLQDIWEQEVLSEVQGATDKQAVQILLAADGAAKKYIKETADPFLRWRKEGGYHAKEEFGGGVPFTNDFYNFLNTGAISRTDTLKKKNYYVLISGLPTDVNPGASVEPHATHLDLQCADGTQRLDNYHFPIKKNFNWSPESCDVVLFQIEVGNTVLTRRYEGTDAFPDFLDDFGGGSHTFYAEDFPGEQLSLQRYGIRSIKVNYNFRGADAVLKDFKGLPEKVPGRIASCWDH